MSAPQASPALSGLRVLDLTRVRAEPADRRAFPGKDRVHPSGACARAQIGPEQRLGHTAHCRVVRNQLQQEVRGTEFVQLHGGAGVNHSLPSLERA